MPSVKIPQLRSKFVKSRAIPQDDNTGDQFAFTDVISFREQPGTPVGEHSGFCVRVRETPGNAPDVFQCEATFKLPEGQVTARGLVVIPRPAGQTDAFGISGGTGAYEDIRGQVKSKKLSETEADYEFDLKG